MKKIAHKFNNFKKKLIPLISLSFNFKKKLIPLISLSFLKKNYKINKFFTKKPKFKISNFNKYLIFLISLLFLYLFYLSLPSLYDKGRLQKDLSNKLLSEFNLNFSLSSDIQYLILPYPHILIKNVKIYNNSLSSPKELIQIKKLKVFISQKNLFDEEKVEITKILIEDANFLIQKDNLKFYKNFLNNKFSKKKVDIKKSNFFYKNNNNETILIFSTLDSKLFYYEKKLFNYMQMHGKIFKIPFNLTWTKNFDDKVNSITSFNAKKLKLAIKNKSFFKDEKYSGKNSLVIKNSKLITDYQIHDNLIIFQSENLKLINNKLNYNGEISIKPFNLKLDINLDTINIKEILNFTIVFKELLKTNLLFNQNLSSQISIKSDKITKNKLFDSLKILLNFDNGKIDLNNSYLISKKIGSFKLNNSIFELDNEEIIFKGSFNFNIKNKNNFFKIFQIPKKNRKFVRNIFFNIEMNFFKDELKISNFKINDHEVILSDEVRNALEFYNDENLKIKNWIDLKKITNKIFESYVG